MQRRSRLAALAVALTAGLLLLSGCDSKKPEDSHDFPSKLTHRVALKPASSQEVIRYIDYADDNMTKVTGQIEYVNGNTAYLVYRKDGTISDVKVVYPLAEGATERQVLRVLKLDADGHTYVKDTTFRADGTLDHEGNLVSTGNFQVMFYHPDGTTPQRHQQFLINNSKKWDLVLDETWRLDRSQESVMRMDGDGSTLKTVYYPDGKTLSEMKGNRWNTSAETTFYWPDGKTVKGKWNQGTWYVEVTEYHQDGTRAVSRRFDSGDWVTVTVFNSKGEPSYSQRWMPDKTGSDPDTTANSVHYKLREINYLNKDGKTVRTVQMADDGKTPALVIIPNGDPWNRTQKTFRPDGTLEKVEVYRDGKVTSTETHAASENVREHVDPSQMKLKPFDAPPPKLVPKGGFFRGPGWF